MSSDRWQSLKAAGAMPQRMLWASTSTKNPDYPDVLYVDELIGADTVNTLPTVTVDAYREKGDPRTAGILEGLDEARAQIASLETLGISMDAVTDQLLAEGVQKFNDAFDGLLADVKTKMSAISAG